MRICRCGYPLHDEKFHEFHDVGLAPPPIGGWIEGSPVFILEDGWDDKPRFRSYTCRMRLIATSPTSGKTLTVNSPQRITELDTRYVHESRFEGDLKP